MPDVSVVIPTHDRLVGLDAMLADLREQDAAGSSFEVVVVDSPEGQDVSSVIEVARAAGLDVRRILTGNTLSGKRNAGAVEARGDLLVFADDDMRLAPGWLAGHVRAHVGHSRALVSGAVEFPADWVRSSNYRRYKNSRHLNPSSGSVDGPIEPHHVVMMNASVARDVYLDAGGTNEEFRAYGGEDVELGYRFARSGVELLYAGAALAEHHELTADVAQFMDKVRTAGRSGGAVVSMAPEATAAPTFRWTEPGAQETGRDRLVHAALVLLSQPVWTGALTRLLQLTDRHRWAYAPLLYKVLSLLSTQRGVRERRTRGESPR